MAATELEHEVTLWMANDIPVRMFYAGQRWRVTDVPTRLRESVWSASAGSPRGLYGWRFQATNPEGDSYVFDVYRTQDDWHVHRAYT
ncbi:hypothetical protein HF576_16480 [Microbacterium sp. CFH 90308]|uniref:Uncharacterized protein n=1 Tax=Microbacterium salsuginis TaxID=2722803 RepID=A0ABX1KFV5_9MICO|nr:hypothetical protein [Microbacterium sp. CFH 90308]NLP85445.1 hypothetical protein [Microbacterium sp. CFH 90308]